MGIEVAIAAQIASSVVSGIAADKAGKEQQKLFKEQAAVVRKEAKRDAGRLRMRHKADNAQFKINALHLGVAIHGSVASNLASRENLQDEEARAIISRGNAQSMVLLKQGQNARNEGRAALIGNFISGASSAFTTAALSNQLGTESLGSGLKLSNPIASSTLQPSVVNPAGSFRDFGGLEEIGKQFVGTN